MRLTECIGAGYDPPGVLGSARSIYRSSDLSKIICENGMVRACLLASLWHFNVMIIRTERTSVRLLLLLVLVRVVVRLFLTYPHTHLHPCGACAHRRKRSSLPSCSSRSRPRSSSLVSFSWLKSMRTSVSWCRYEASCLVARIVCFGLGREDMSVEHSWFPSSGIPQTV